MSVPTENFVCSLPVSHLLSLFSLVLYKFAEAGFEPSCLVPRLVGVWAAAGALTPPASPTTVRTDRPPLLGPPPGNLLPEPQKDETSLAGYSEFT